MGRPTKPTTTTSKIATIMRAIGRAASDDATRYNLCGVYVETDKETGAVTMTATNGHWLATVELPRATVTTEGPDGPVAWTVKNGLYRVKEDSAIIDLGMTPEPIDLGGMQFPYWRQVIPKASDDGERAKVWNLNAEYVGEAMEICARIHKVFSSSKGGIPVTFRAPPDDLTPVLWERKTTDYHVRVVIMPMRM